MSESDKPLSDQPEQPTPAVSDSREEETIEEAEAERDVYTCPECSKVFDNENSLKMHMLRSHRISPHEEKAKPTPERREVKPRPIRERGEPLVPDVETQLSNFLVTFGLSSRDSSATIEYLRSFGFDNLVKLNHALSDIGVSLSRRRLIIEAWANARDIRIPLQIAQSLTIKPYRPYQPYREGYDFEEPYEYGYRRPKQEGGDILSGLAKVIEALKTSAGGDPQLMRELGKLETQVENIMSRPMDTGNSQVVSSLSKQVEDLSAKLEAEKEKRLFDKIDTLTKEVQDVKNRATSAESAYGVLNTSIVSLKELAKEYFEIAKVAIGFKSGSSKPPTREKVEMPKDVESPLQRLAREHPELVEEG